MDQQTDGSRHDTGDTATRATDTGATDTGATDTGATETGATATGDPAAEDAYWIAVPHRPITAVPLRRKVRSKAPAIRAFLYDECEIYRIGLRTVLESTSDIAIVGEAGGPEAMATIGAARPTVVLVGVPGLGGAADVVRAIRRQVSSPRPIAVLVLAADFDHEAILAVLFAGARGYLHRDTPASQLIPAVRSVAEGGAVLAPSVADSLVERISGPPHQSPTAAAYDHVSLDVLTPRQHEVLSLVAEGLPNVDIAQRLQLSVATVKSHLSVMLQKFCVRDRTQLAVLAHQRGLTTRDVR